MISLIAYSSNLNLYKKRQQRLLTHLCRAMPFSILFVFLLESQTSLTEEESSALRQTCLVSLVFTWDETDVFHSNCPLSLGKLMNEINSLSTSSLFKLSY